MMKWNILNFHISQYRNSNKWIQSIHNIFIGNKSLVCTKSMAFIVETRRALSITGIWLESKAYLKIKVGIRHMVKFHLLQHDETSGMNAIKWYKFCFSDVVHIYTGVIWLSFKNYSHDYSFFLTKKNKLFRSKCVLTSPYLLSFCYFYFFFLFLFCIRMKY